MSPRLADFLVLLLLILLGWGAALLLRRAPSTDVPHPDHAADPAGAYCPDWPGSQ